MEPSADFPPMCRAAVALPSPSETLAAGLSSPYFLRSAGDGLSDTIDFICADMSRPMRPYTAEASDAVLIGFVRLQSLPDFASSRPLPPASIEMRSILSR